MVRRREHGLISRSRFAISYKQSTQVGRRGILRSSTLSTPRETWVGSKLGSCTPHAFSEPGKVNIIGERHETCQHTQHLLTF